MELKITNKTKNSKMLKINERNETDLENEKYHVRLDQERVVGGLSPGLDGRTRLLLPGLGLGLGHRRRRLVEETATDRGHLVAVVDDVVVVRGRVAILVRGPVRGPGGARRQLGLYVRLLLELDVVALLDVVSERVGPVRRLAVIQTPVTANLDLER